MLSSGVFDHVIVTTDDDEIADVAETAGASAPFRRPAELSDDHTGTGAVIRHAIQALVNGGHAAVDANDRVCLVYPAAVFVTPDDLRRSLVVLESEDVDYVFSARATPLRSKRRWLWTPTVGYTCSKPDHLLTRSQDLADRFHDVGQFYWGSASAWAERIPVMTGRSKIHDPKLESPGHRYSR